MPFLQRVIEPKYLSRTSLWNDDGKPQVTHDELETVTNNTLCNALRQLASLVLVANDIFTELGNQLQSINRRSDALKTKLHVVQATVSAYDPKKVTVPESDICTFALLKNHFTAKYAPETNLFTADTRPQALKEIYDAATKTPVHLMRQMDRWRRDGHRSSRFFMCTPILGAKRRRMQSKVDIDIETSMPAIISDLRRWTSSEALGEITVTPNCPNRIAPNITTTDGDLADGTIVESVNDRGIDHTLPSPEEQLQLVALKFPAEIIVVDISGRNFNRISTQRRSLLPDQLNTKMEGDSNSPKRRTRSRKPKCRRRNTLAGTDQKEIRDALTGGEETCPSTNGYETKSSTIGAVSRSKSSDLLRSNKKDSPSDKKSHFNALKQWGRNRYDRFMNKCSETKKGSSDVTDIDDFNIYETVTMKRKRTNIGPRNYEHNLSISSSDKSSVHLPNLSSLSSVMNIAVKLRDSSAQRKQRRTGGNKEEPHSSSGNWSASSESGRASIGSEFTTTTQPKSTTSAATSSNSLNQPPAPNSVNSRRRFNINNSTSSSITSEGTLTPDIIHDLHEDGETSSIYSCDTEGYYTSFHMDSGLKTLKEEELPCTPLHSTSAFSNSGSNSIVLTPESEYELFGKGSTSTTTSSAGTVCTALLASESNRSLNGCPAVPERKSSLSKFTQKNNSETVLEKYGDSDKTGTVKRSPATIKDNVIAIVHNESNGNVSPDSGHNTSSSPIESINSPNGVRSGSDFEFSESSDMEGFERTERIRIKTTINSSRIPSMCVITPPHSDDESIKSYNFFNNFTKQYLDDERSKLDFNLITGKHKIQFKKSSDPDKENYNIQRVITTNVNGTNRMQLVNVNLQSGYATVENFDNNENKIDVNKDSKVLRAPSPSGGTVTINESPLSASPSQPIIKATLFPLNNMLDRLKNNLVNLTNRKESTSTTRNNNDISDSGEYVTLADVRNNNKKSSPPLKELLYVNDLVKQPIEQTRTTEYVSLDELSCNINNQNSVANSMDSLEKKRRQGARVTLDAEGKVVYSSDSLRRHKGAHTTFEPGPFIKMTDNTSQSPLPIHRVPKTVRPVNITQNSNRPLSPQLGKLVIRAISGMASTNSEVVRYPGTTIVASSAHPTSPKPVGQRGAYVHIQDTGSNLLSTQDKERVPSPSNYPALYLEQTPNHKEMSNIRDFDENNMDRTHAENQYYFQKGSSMYQTLPSKRTDFYRTDPERSVTPDITRGLERKSMDRTIIRTESDTVHQKLGIPVQIPEVNNFRSMKKVPLKLSDSYTPTQSENWPTYSYFTNTFRQKSYENHYDTLRISPIDPRQSGSFKSSTPSTKTHDLKKIASLNLENKLLSPKKSTMTNEELLTVIHKSKKKMNINTEDNTVAPMSVSPKSQPKTPETGYLDSKSRSRLSWSPRKGEYIDFNESIDKLSPSNESRSRQSWACSDRKGSVQTSRLDFKKLLLQKNSNSSKKISAVEQLRLSKEQIQPSQSLGKHIDKPQSVLNILELSGSPRSLVNRKFTNLQGVRSAPDKQKSASKLMSPRSQWRFANPRTDVLSSTILEDCREDESPNNSMKKEKSLTSSKIKNNNCLEKLNKNEISTNQLKRPSAMVENRAYMSITQRMQAQRAQFFTQANRGQTSGNVKNNEFDSQNKEKCSVTPTLETAF